MHLNELFILSGVIEATVKFMFINRFEVPRNEQWLDCIYYLTTFIWRSCQSLDLDKKAKPSGPVSHLSTTPVSSQLVEEKF